jgi:oligopeptide/dipeptide ABC transporter ATP-binding protein
MTLVCRDLVVEYASAGYVVRPIDGLDLEVAGGELALLLGSSGCGKTSLLSILAGILTPSRGSVVLDGLELTALGGRDLTAYRRRRVGVVFQSFNLIPSLTAAENVEIPLRAAGRRGRVARARAAELLNRVGLSARRTHRPSELSGGEQQRVAIARALALDPALIVCDEAVSSLDVLIQAQVLNLFERLRAELGLSYVFIAHDLALVKQVSDRVAVMHLGQLAEIGPADALYRNPLHPYTAALLASVPGLDPATGRVRRPVPLRGEPPSPLDPPSGCRFRTRCPRAQAKCAAEEPALRERSPGHSVACHFPLDRTPSAKEEK